MSFPLFGFELSTLADSILYKSRLTIIMDCLLFEQPLGFNFTVEHCSCCKVQPLHCHLLCKVQLITCSIYLAYIRLPSLCIPNKHTLGSNFHEIHGCMEGISATSRCITSHMYPNNL